MFWRISVYFNGQTSSYDCPRGVAILDDALNIVKNVYGQDVTITGYEYLDSEPSNNNNRGGGLFSWF